MSTMRIALFGAVALLQIGVAGSMVWQHATTLTAGRVWKFRTAPVDPVDAFRGRYVALRFAAEESARAAAGVRSEGLFASERGRGRLCRSRSSNDGTGSG